MARTVPGCSRQVIPEVIRIGSRTAEIKDQQGLRASTVVAAKLVTPALEQHAVELQPVFPRRHRSGNHVVPAAHLHLDGHR